MGGGGISGQAGARDLQGAALQGPIAIKLHHPDEVGWEGEEGVAGGEDVADLHEGFVLGLGDDDVDVQGHQQADATENQVAKGTS